MKRVRLETVHAASASWTKRVGLFSAVLALVAAAGHRFGLIDTPPMALALVLAALLAILALVIALRAASRIWIYGDAGTGEVVLGVAVAVAVLCPFAYAGYQASSLPWLYDISTDTDDPPLLRTAATSHRPGMNIIGPIGDAAAELQRGAYPLVISRRYTASADRVADAVRGLMQRYGWRIVSQPAEDEDDGELDFEATTGTLLLKLPVDLAVRLLESDDATFVDMRSASRYGPHDLGDNAARIEGFLAELDVDVAGLATAPAE